MKTGPNTRRFLAALNGPPCADDIKDLAFAMAWDGDVEWLQRTSEIMVDHHLRSPRGDADQRDENTRAFNWWLGIRSMVTSMVNGREHRKLTRGGR